MHRRILSLAIPNILSNLSVPLLGMVDTALMGQLDDSALYIGAISLGSILFNILYWGFAFLRMGTTGLTAQAFGQQDQAESSMILGRSLLVGLGGGLLLLLLQGPIGWLGFSLLKGEPAMKALAEEYYYIRIYAAPATIGLYAFHGWFLGMQNAFIPMLLTILVNALNIGLNFWFVFAWGMKSDGVALATVCAQYSALLLALGLLVWRYRPYLRAFARKGLWEAEALARFFAVNRDIFIRTLCLIAVFTFFTNESAGVSTEVLAANSILMQFFYTFSFAIDGFAYAAESLVGRFVGAGEREALKQVIRKLFLWGIGLAVAFSLVFWWGGETIAGIFTQKESLVQLSLQYLPYVILVSLVGAFAFIWDGIYIGATASVAMRNSMLFALGMFAVSYLSGSLAWDGNNHVLWLSMTVFMAARGISLHLLAPRHIFFRPD